MEEECESSWRRVGCVCVQLGSYPRPSDAGLGIALCDLLDPELWPGQFLGLVVSLWFLSSLCFVGGEVPCIDFEPSGFGQGTVVAR